MKRFKYLLMGLIVLGTVSYGAVSNSDTSTITIEAISAPEIVVGDIDFGQYITGDVNPGMKTANIALAKGRATRTVTLSVEAKKVDLTNASDSGEKVVANVAVREGEEDIVLDATGGGASTLEVTLDNLPTVDGVYSGVATITVQYK